MPQVGIVLVSQDGEKKTGFCLTAVLSVSIVHGLSFTCTIASRRLLSNSSFPLLEKVPFSETIVSLIYALLTFCLGPFKRKDEALWTPGSVTKTPMSTARPPNSVFGSIERGLDKMKVTTHGRQIQGVEAQKF